MVKRVLQDTREVRGGVINQEGTIFTQHSPRTHLLFHKKGEVDLEQFWGDLDPYLMVKTSIIYTVSPKDNTEIGLRY